VIEQPKNPTRAQAGTTEYLIQLKERRSIKVHRPASLSKPMQIAFVICSNILIQRERNSLLRTGNDLTDHLSV
jgi:hypothetical protein